MTKHTLSQVSGSLTGKAISYCPESGNAMRYFQILKVEKVGVSKKTQKDYLVAELRDLEDNKLKVRTLLLGNIVSNHLLK